MNSYEFEEKISSYIEGDLKYSEVKEFELLMNSNSELKEKVESVRNMINDLNNLEEVKTSNNFINNLHNRIDSQKPTFFQRIKEFRFYGLDYVSTMGIATAIIIITSTTLLLLNPDKILTKISVMLTNKL